MTYLLSVQKAIAQTDKFFAPSAGEYQSGWEEVKADLEYAISLGEMATQQHLQIWEDCSTIDLEGDWLGYAERMKAIQLILEKWDG